MRFLLSVALLLTSVPSWTQQTGGITAGMSLFPVYPLNGRISVDLENQFVFIDPNDALDLIVSYPEALGTADFKADTQRPRRVLKIRSRKHVRPAASVQVVQDAEGNYLYRYKFENALGAQQEISAIDLPAASLQAVETTTQPGSWQSSKSDRTQETHMRWFAQTAQNRIPPGSGLGGFTILSKLKPGFAPVFFQGPPSSDLSHEKLPEPVLEQLKPFQQLEGNSQAEMVITPRYNPETNLPMMVGEFYGAIESLLIQGKLNSDSAFVKEILSALKNYGDAAEAAGDIPVEEFVGPSLEINQKPASVLESEIYAALKLSVNFK